MSVSTSSNLGSVWVIIVCLAFPSQDYNEKFRYVSWTEKDHDKFSEAQRSGFELVETQVGFKTKIEKVNSIDTDYRYVRMAKDSDVKAILDITTKCFLDNPKFISRFKNKNFFTKDHFIKYYNLSITNYFNEKNSYTSVVEKEGKVIGYYMIIDEGDFYSGGDDPSDHQPGFPRNQSWSFRRWKNLIQ